MNQRTLPLEALGEIFDGPHATPTRRDDGPYFLNIASLSSGRLDLSRSDHVSEQDFKKWTRRVTPQGGDLLFSYETRLGEAALMPEGLKACLGRRMALLRPDRAVVEPKFLLYFYLSPTFQETIRRNTIHGVTVNRIGLSSLGSWKVDLPGLPLQRAIAEVLGALDDKIAANTHLVTTSDELGSALVRHAVDHGSDLALSELADIVMGSSPPGESYNEGGDGAIFYQGVRDFGVRFPTHRVWTTQPVRMAARHDALVSVRAPVGRINLAAEETCVGRGLAALRSLTSRPMTLFHLLKNNVRIWESYEDNGTVFGSINKKQLANLRVPTIPEHGAGEIEGKLAAVESRIECALAESESLASVRDTLLPALMSGRLWVKDAERVVEGAV